MALCINQSGTWRNITTLCVNQSGTWKKVVLGCINESNTWRKYRDARITREGCSFGGGRAVSVSSGVVWVVAPSSSQVTRTYPSINDAVIRAQQVSGCAGWFIPGPSELQSYGGNLTSASYWDAYTPGHYWSSSSLGWGGISIVIPNGAWYGRDSICNFSVRAFRCVTY
jgi:hypothetical protein